MHGLWRLRRSARSATFASLSTRAGRVSRSHRCRCLGTLWPHTSHSPIAQLFASPATLASWATWPPTRFAVVERVVDVLAGGPIRGGLQAHLTAIRAAKQPPAATPMSLWEGTNLATPAIAGVASLLLRSGKLCRTTTAESATV